MSLQPGPDDRADDSSPLAGTSPADSSVNDSTVNEPAPPPPWDAPPPAPWEVPPPAPWTGAQPPPPPPGPAAQVPPGAFVGTPYPYVGAPGPTGAPGGAPMGYGPPAPGYGAWGPGGYPAPVGTESRAIVGLVLAILSWVFCPVVLAVAALVVAGQSDRAIAASGGAQDGRGMNTATRWISWANIAVFALVIVAGILFFAVVATVGPEISMDESTRF